MNVEAVNAVLVKAIIGLQAGEIDAMAEAMATGATNYDVPSPKGAAGGYRVPSPKDLEPKGGSRDVGDRMLFSGALLKQMKRLKKDVPGVKSIRQGYKGTGGQRDRRQVFVRFVEDGERQRNIDLFIEPGYILLGGVMNHGNGHVMTKDRTVKEVYKDLVAFLKRHASGGK